MHLLNFESGTDISVWALGSLSFLTALEVCIQPVGSREPRLFLVTALLVCSPEIECGKCREVVYRACFQSQLCSKGPFVQTLSCSAGGCLLHDARGNRDFFVVWGQLPSRQKLNWNQLFPFLSLPKSGYHSACALRHEFSGAVHVWWFGSSWW